MSDATCFLCGRPRGEEFWACVQWCNACVEEYDTTVPKGRGIVGLEEFIARKKSETVSR